MSLRAAAFLTFALRAAGESWAVNANSACRWKADGSDRCQDPCDKYDIIIIKNNMPSCKELCGWRGDCTGFEFNQGNGRCEIWKVPILGVASSNGNVCTKRSNGSPTHTPLYVTVSLKQTGLNVTALTEDYPAQFPALVLQGLRTNMATVMSDLKDQTGIQVANLTASDIVAAYDPTSEMFTLIFSPQDDVNPIALYSLMRGSNIDQIPNLVADLETKLGNFVSYFPFQLKGTKYAEGNIFKVSIAERTISNVAPVTQTMTTTTAAATTTTAAKTAGNQGGAKIADDAFQASRFALALPMMGVIMLAFWQ